MLIFISAPFLMIIPIVMEIILSIGMLNSITKPLMKSTMGFVFQQPTMVKDLNLLDNIIFPALREKNPKNVIIEKGKNLMARTGLAGLEDHLITEVSGVQLQRAGICRAQINSPDIIFADEPTGSLNSKSANEIMDLLAKINDEEKAMLINHLSIIAKQVGFSNNIKKYSTPN